MFSGLPLLSKQCGTLYQIKISCSLSWGSNTVYPHHKLSLQRSDQVLDLHIIKTQNIFSVVSTDFIAVNCSVFCLFLTAFCDFFFFCTGRGAHSLLELKKRPQEKQNSRTTALHGLFSWNLEEVHYLM